MQSTQKPAASEAVIKSRKKRESTKNLVAYSFTALNFIGFAVFILVLIVFLALQKYFVQGYCQQRLEGVKSTCTLPVAKGRVSIPPLGNYL